MDFLLCIYAFISFGVGFPASALFLRCGLEASLHFSPRTAIELATLSSLSGALALLLIRGPTSVPCKQRALCMGPAFVGGCIGQALLLMFSARFPGSITLARLQIVPLFLFTIAALLTRISECFSLNSRRLLLISLLCSLIDGFFGAGGLILFSLFTTGGVKRRQQIPSCALLVTCISRASALLLILLTGEAQLLPSRMVIAVAAGSAAGAVLWAYKNERGTLAKGLRTALTVYLVLAAASCAEQAITAG